MADKRLRQLQARSARTDDLGDRVALAYEFQRIGATPQATQELRKALQQNVTYAPAREAMAEINPLGWTGMVYGSYAYSTHPGLRIVEPGKEEKTVAFGRQGETLRVFYLAGQLHVGEFSRESHDGYVTCKLSFLDQDGSLTEYFKQQGDVPGLRPRHLTGDLVDTHIKKGSLLGKSIYVPRNFILDGFVGPDMIVSQLERALSHYRLTESSIGRCAYPTCSEDQVLNNDQRFPHHNIAASELDLRFAFNGSFTEIGIHVLDALDKVGLSQEDAPQSKSYHPSHHYHEGTLLRHNSFGEGKVLSSGPRSIDVDFGEHGVKKLVHRKN